jgi:hypothetical protein
VDPDEMVMGARIVENTGGTDAPQRDLRPLPEPALARTPRAQRAEAGGQRAEEGKHLISGRLGGREFWFRPNVRPVRPAESADRSSSPATTIRKG